MSIPFRPSLVITQPKPGAAVQQGDREFGAELRRHYGDVESSALESVLQLKKKLRSTNDAEFWHTFCDGAARTLDAQYAVMAKREQDSLPVGEVGSCLMALCWYYDDGYGNQGSAKQIKYHAYSCPCSLMKHQKVVLIPEGLNETFPDNPNKLTFPAEAYLAIPLFDGDICIAHFGLLWTKEALQRRRLTWGFSEMLLHSLEDIVLDRFLRGAEFPKNSPSKSEMPPIPFETIAALHSLKPFARNLSHELRTPMQGIVGMLDIMSATLHDAAKPDTSPEMAIVLDELKDNLEVIQSSTKRAVEASDNVVQAYALNLGLPELNPPTPPFDLSDRLNTNFDTETSNSPTKNVLNQGIKRQQDDESNYISANKRARLFATQSDGADSQPLSQTASSESEELGRQNTYSPSLLFSTNSGLQFVNTREAINFAVKESLKACGNSPAGYPVGDDMKRSVEVRETLSSGAERSKVVEWVIHQNVPKLILVDERMFVKMISRVFQNALKFTEDGLVKLVARFCPKRQHIVISIKDTGPGIPEHFKPRIFTPFAREDDSTTRQKEGLGLGLLVAKGLARKLGGDLTLVSSDTSGANRGCEFEIDIPASPNGIIQHTNPKITTVQMTLDHDYVGGQQQPSPNTTHQSTTPSSPDCLSLSRTLQPPGENVIPTTESNFDTKQSLPHSPPLSPQHPNIAVIDQQQPPALQSNNPLPEILPTHQDTPEHDKFLVPTTPATTRPNRSKSPLIRRPSQIFDRTLATTHPLTFLVAEDNPVNRKLLVTMLTKLGYDPKTQIYEAYDGADAVRKVKAASQSPPAEGESRIKGPVDVVLMDIWMPLMDGYEATAHILGMFRPRRLSTLRTMSAPEVPSLMATSKMTPSQAAWCTTLRARELLPPTILAVTADATDGAFERAKSAGMEGFMVKPFRVTDLEKLIREGWARREKGIEARRVDLV